MINKLRDKYNFNDYAILIYFITRYKFVRRYNKLIKIARYHMILSCL